MTDRQLAKDLEAIDQIVRLADELRRNLPILYERDRFTTLPDGYPRTVSYEPGHGSAGWVVANEVGDPERVVATAVEVAAVGRLHPTPDEVRHHRRMATSELWAGLRHVSTSLGNVRLALTNAEAARGRVSQVSECLNCGRTVAGTDNDRLRGGRCEPCYKRHIRNPDSPRLIATDEEAG